MAVQVTRTIVLELPSDEKKCCKTNRIRGRYVYIDGESGPKEAGSL